MITSHEKDSTSLIKDEEQQLKKLIKNILNHKPEHIEIWQKLSVNNKIELIITICEYLTEIALGYFNFLVKNTFFAQAFKKF